ncbi:Hypothetical predicted protein [Lecanosticta acicola]|uniref:Uncharacterized protein n=1 Tax=Lecanosticta acicola TaxID=111012 RepID=A0AAI8Z0U3_9PEZI|nr:Hypothetical predicted protein [Lecanosticta acicola]
MSYLIYQSDESVLQADELRATAAHYRKISHWVSYYKKLGEQNSRMAREKLQQDNDNLRIQNAQLSSDLEAAQRAILDAKTANGNLINDLETAKDAVDTYKKSNVLLQEETRRLAAEVSEEQAEHAITSADRQGLGHEAGDRVREYDELFALHTSSLDELEAVKTTSNRRQTKLKSVRETYQHMKDEIERLKINQDTLITELSVRNAEVRRLHTIRDLVIDAKRWSEMQNRQEKSEGEIEDKDRDIRNLDATNSKAATLLVEATNEIYRLRAQASSLRAELSETGKQISEITRLASISVAHCEDAEEIDGSQSSHSLKRKTPTIDAPHAKHARQDH